jgi:hypothetical protein
LRASGKLVHFFSIPVNQLFHKKGTATGFPLEKDGAFLNPFFANI